MPPPSAAPSSQLQSARVCHPPTPHLSTIVFPLPLTHYTADIVQDLYLKELKAYKPAPVKANDSEGQVQKFAVPKPPHSPEEADLQSGLQEYEASTPEVQGASSDASAAPVEQDWFVEEEEEAEAHGH